MRFSFFFNVSPFALVAKMPFRHSPRMRRMAFPNSSKTWDRVRFSRDQLSVYSQHIHLCHCHHQIIIIATKYLQVQILLVHSIFNLCSNRSLIGSSMLKRERTLKALKCDLLEVEISDSIIEAHFMFPVRQPVPSQVSSGVCLHVRAVNHNSTNSLRSKVRKNRSG